MRLVKMPRPTKTAAMNTAAPLALMTTITVTTAQSQTHLSHATAGPPDRHRPRTHRLLVAAAAHRGPMSRTTCPAGPPPEPAAVARTRTDSAAGAAAAPLVPARHWQNCPAPSLVQTTPALTQAGSATARRMRVRSPVHRPKPAPALRPEHPRPTGRPRPQPDAERSAARLRCDLRGRGVGLRGTT